MKELNQTCMNMKKMKKIKETFVANVGLKDWKEAKTMYPLFANEKSLGELFLQCNFTPVPSVFSEYCSKAVKYVSLNQYYTVPLIYHFVQ